jgi:hypothetical protein
MPEKRTIERARKDLRRGKSASTAAGEFVRQEMHHIREGKHGAKSAKQAIAIGLSEARRAGVPIGDKPGAKPSRRRKDSVKSPAKTSARRSRASLERLKKQPRRAASHLALSRQAHKAARKRAKSRYNSNSSRP